MAKFPNMKPANDNWSISASWQQPLMPTHYNPFVERDPYVATVAYADAEVEKMLTYPDAEAIIKRVTNGDNK
jgi:hypothetical protein